MKRTSVLWSLGVILFIVLGLIVTLAPTPTPQPPPTSVPPTSIPPTMAPPPTAEPPATQVPPPPQPPERHKKTATPTPTLARVVFPTGGTEVCTMNCWEKLMLTQGAQTNNLLSTIAAKP
jgi:hypothetical protein